MAPNSARRHVGRRVPHDRRGRHDDARLEDDRLPPRPRRGAARRARGPLVPRDRRTTSTSTSARASTTPADPSGALDDAALRRCGRVRPGPILAPSGAASRLCWSRGHLPARRTCAAVLRATHRERFPRGFCHQEASQAHGQEEAPQAAEEDARPASQARQVAPARRQAGVEVMGRVVLVTGISRDIGRRFARAAATDPSIDRVIGVDVVPPRGDIGDVSFVRADIRNPVIAKVIAKEDVDTVVHMSVIATPGSAGGRNTMKEHNVMGTMQLLAACQKAPALRAPRRQVDDDGVRRQPATPRCSPRRWGPSGCPAPATPRTSTRSRATSAASRAAVPTSP